MEQDLQLLKSIHRAAKNSIHSINSLEKSLSSGENRSLLQQQRKEYETIAQTAQQLLRLRGQGVWPGAIPRLEFRSRGQQLEQRKRDSLEGLRSSLRSVNQMQTVDPKVADLNRQLLLSRQADVKRMEQLF